MVRVGFYFILEEQGKSHTKGKFEHTLERTDRVNSVTIKGATKKQKV